LLMIGLPVFVYMGWSRRGRRRGPEQIVAPSPEMVPETRPLVGVGER